jgi:hypothetical protein
MGMGKFVSMENAMRISILLSYRQGFMDALTALPDALLVNGFQQKKNLTAKPVMKEEIWLLESVLILILIAKRVGDCHQKEKITVTIALSVQSDVYLVHPMKME